MGKYIYIIAVVFFDPIHHTERMKKRSSQTQHSFNSNLVQLRPKTIKQSVTFAEGTLQPSLLVDFDTKNPIYSSKKSLLKTSKWRINSAFRHQRSSQSCKQFRAVKYNKDPRSQSHRAKYSVPKQQCKANLTFTTKNEILIRYAITSLHSKFTQLIHYNAILHTKSLPPSLTIYNELSLPHYPLFVRYDVKNFLSKVKLLISNDVETNPGPECIDVSNKSDLTICTYNVNGLKEHKKLKRLTHFINKLPFNRNGVINFQETHLTVGETIKLDLQWRHGACHSPAFGASAGVSILYNKSYFDEVSSTHNDNHGRMCSFTALKNEAILCFINIYSPNNHAQAVEFFDQLNDFMTDELLQRPTTKFFVSGDFNLILDPDRDSIGRNQSRQEKIAVDKLKDVMIQHNLKDSYRCLNAWGGFSWGRDNPSYLRSRLDMILISSAWTDKLRQSTVTKTPGESDHSFLYSAINIQEVNQGRGIIKCNATLLNDETIKEKIIVQLRASEDEIPNSWNPHQKLDFLKIKIRDAMLHEGKLLKNTEISTLQRTNKEIDLLERKREKLLIERNKNTSHDSRISLESKINSITEALKITEESLIPLKEKEASRLIFRSRAKWAEEGEKSTKYFLNLVKERQSKMQIRKIVSNGHTHTKPDEIEKAITAFYKDLYSKQPNLVNTNDEDFLSDLPQITEEQKIDLSAPITLSELEMALKTCNESAPGYDGITYDTYKALWNITGKYVCEAWNYSMAIKKTAPSQQLSIISLLEKKGKDKTKIENLRPISLSNCDIKICTKAIAIRTNKVLANIINKTQTGYVPGRQVNDNNRLIEEIINLYNERKQKAYLITLDAQKAFDSVDHSYLKRCLKAFGFPETYIDQVETVYTGLKASVLINGHFTETINIDQSVKQGDSLSCALFIIAIEPLLRQFKESRGIKPLILNPGQDVEETISNASYADDITGLCTNIKGIQRIITTYEKFSKMSGIKLNVPKTEILIIGAAPDEVHNFKIRFDNRVLNIVSQSSVKICGIVFSNDHNEAYQENIVNKIAKLERQLNLWRQRNISLEGEILLAKTFGLSQIIYSLQATHITTGN